MDTEEVLLTRVARCFAVRQLSTEDGEEWEVVAAACRGEQFLQAVRVLVDHYVDDVGCVSEQHTYDALGSDEDDESAKLKITRN